MTEKYQISKKELINNCLEVILIINNDIKNFSYLFCGCNSLLFLSDKFSELNMSNVTDIQCMFACSTSLKSLPDISQWDISKVTKIKKLFYDCFSLRSFQIYQNGILQI